jgi:hypothetical protein
MDFETDVEKCDPFDIGCVDAVAAKYGIPSLTATYNPSALNTARGSQMDANALAAAALNTANTANTATTGGGNITAADILNLPLTEEAKERIARENAVYDALEALRIALDNQDFGIETQRSHNRQVDEINAAYANGDITRDEWETQLVNAASWANQQYKNNPNATEALALAQQAVQDLGITRTEISDWDAAYSPSNPISPRLGTGATLWEKAGDVGSDVLSAIAEATDWTGEAFGEITGVGDPDQFGPTIPNLGVGWQWGVTGKQMPVRIGTAKDGTPIVIYMPGGGAISGGITGAQEGGIWGGITGAWEGIGGLGGIAESTIKPTLAMTDDDTEDTKGTVILSGSDDTVGGEGVVGEVTVSEPSKSKVETFSDAPEVGGLSTLPQDPNIAADIALMTDPNITRDIGALPVDPASTAAIKTNVKPDYAGSISTLEGDPTKRAQVILGEEPDYTGGLGALEGAPNITADIDTLLTNPAYRAEMERQGEPVIRADMTALDGTATARGESRVWESPMQRAMVVLNEEAAPQASLVDDTVYTTTVQANVGDAQETDSIRGSSVNVAEPTLRGSLVNVAEPTLRGSLVNVAEPTLRASSVNLNEPTLRGSSSALKTGTLRGSSGGGGGGGGMGAPGGSGIGVGAGGPGDLVDIEYLFERFGDTIFAPRLTEEEEDDLLYTYT